MKQKQNKKVLLSQINEFLNKELKLDEIKDMSLNGVQVGDNKQAVKKVGLAVDACLSTFEKARKENCDLLIVHHGLFWGKPETITNMMYDRVNFLIKNDIALMGIHLPLDLHPKYGNNIGLAKALKLTKIKSFGLYHGVPIGVSGQLTKRIKRKEFVSLCEKVLGKKPVSFDFGSETIQNVGIVSGGGSMALAEAKEAGLDVLLTGEGPHQTYHESIDMGMNLMFGGHYHTETFGVKALGKVLEDKFGVKTCFIDYETQN